MALILPGIGSLAQHVHTLQDQPEAYRPERCPHCGKAGVWCHGSYTRKADRQGRGKARLDPVPIARFLCPHCQSTCSELPECVPPRRWYLWSVQQVVVLWLAAGESVRAVARKVPAARRTIGRWWRRLGECFPLHSAVLRSRFAELGRHDSVSRFWAACCAHIPFSQAMVLIHQGGIAIP